MVQRITRAPPPRLTNFQAAWPSFALRLEPFTIHAPALAAAALGFLLFASLALPFAAPAFLGLAAFGSAIGLATVVTSLNV